MLKCPKCNSENINQYRMLTGKIWCFDCNYSVPEKEKYNPFIVNENKFEDTIKDAIQNIDQDLTVNKMEQIRAKNNSNWMDLVRLALKYAPDETKEILKKIVNHDKAVIKICEKLANDK